MTIAYESVDLSLNLVVHAENDWVIVHTGLV